MDRTFQKFLRSGLDLAPLGVERREENLPYFCTPKGAAIFGWAGIDGIHYCLIRAVVGAQGLAAPAAPADLFFQPAVHFCGFLSGHASTSTSPRLAKSPWSVARFSPPNIVFAPTAI